MRMAAASRVGFLVIVGSVTLAMSSVGCQQETPGSPRATGGNENSGGTNAGGSNEGGSGGNNEGGSGGSNEGGSGGSNEGGSGGSNEGGSGGSNEGGSGGSNEGGSGGSNEGGSGGSSEGGSGGSDTGGSGGSSEGGSGGSSEGGSGGSSEGGSGGSDTGGSSGSGGSQPTVGCSSPIKPENGGSGNVTDFSDYSTGSGKWGSTSNVYGSIYKYQGSSSTMAATVDTTAKTLHAIGTVAAGDYAGTGISFEVCATVVDFTQVQFTISGSIGKCDLELQIKTFDQSPVSGDPPGGCESESDCYNYPSFKQVAVPSATATDVIKDLSEFSSWSAANAKQVVGLQWQVTGSSTMDGDAGATCDVDIEITNIKFLP